MAKKYENYCYVIAYGILQSHEDAKECVFEIIYTVEDGTRSVLLENLEWVKFVPFEKGYF